MDDTNPLCEELSAIFDWHQARINCLGNLIFALLTVKTVNLSQISIAFKGKASKGSKYRRLQRFFREVRISQYVVAKFIGKLLARRSEEKWVLAMDRTNWKFGKKDINILMLAVVVEGVAIPLIWSFLQKKGNSSTEERISLMNRYRHYFGVSKMKYLTGDREFVGSEWIQYLKDNKIPYVLRIRNNFKMTTSTGKITKASNLFRNLAVGKEKCLGLRQLWGHQVHVQGLNLGSREYLILISCEDAAEALSKYSKRWNIETMFGSLKSKGLGFEDTHMYQIEKLKNLMAILAIAFCWAYLVGEWRASINPPRIKSHGRKAIGIFKMGLDHIQTVLFHSNFGENMFLEIMSVITLGRE